MGTGSNAAAGAAIGSVIPGVGTAIGGALGAGLDIYQNFFGKSKKQKLREQQQSQANAYLDYLQNFRNQWKGELQDYYKTGDEQFEMETGGVLPELANLQGAIREEGTDVQQDYRKQLMSDLARQGVKGGQASTLLSRGTGDLSRGMQRDLTSNLYQEALDRRNKRSAYYADKAMKPYSTLTSQNVLMPSETEKQMKFASIYR